MLSIESRVAALRPALTKDRATLRFSAANAMNRLGDHVTFCTKCRIELRESLHEEMFCTRGKELYRHQEAVFTVLTEAK